MTDWRDSTFHRQQLQRLSHQQPLIGLEYEQPWMTWRGWAVCAVAAFVFVWSCFL